jgi:hypothetical protein
MTHTPDNAEVGDINADTRAHVSIPAGLYAVLADRDIPQIVSGAIEADAHDRRITLTGALSDLSAIGDQIHNLADLRQTGTLPWEECRYSRTALILIADDFPVVRLPVTGN